MNKTFVIYTDKIGNKYKIHPTLQWFDKENDLIVGEEKIKTLRFSSLLKRIEKTLGIELIIPVTGAFEITDNEDFGISPHVKHTINHSKYFYTLTFDESEPLQNREKE